MSDLNESHLISRALDDGLDLREFASELSTRLTVKVQYSVEKGKPLMSQHSVIN